MISSEELQQLHMNICQALGDPKRIQILYALHARPRNVTALAEVLDAPQPTVSRHLGILHEKGLVTRERDGSSMIYSLAHPEIIQALEVMRSILRATLEAQSSFL